MVLNAISNTYISATVYRAIISILVIQVLKIFQEIADKKGDRRSSDLLKTVTCRASRQKGFCINWTKFDVIEPFGLSLRNAQLRHIKIVVLTSIPLHSSCFLRCRNVYSWLQEKEIIHLLQQSLGIAAL